MKYRIYEQGFPIDTGERDKDRKKIFVANIELRYVDDCLNVDEAIKTAKFAGLRFPMVSAVGGYTDDGYPRESLQ